MDAARAVGELLSSAAAAGVVTTPAALAQRYLGIVWVAKKNKYRARVRPKQSERGALPDHLKKLDGLTAGYYVQPEDAARAADRILHKLGRAENNGLLTLEERAEVDATSWEALMAGHTMVWNSPDAAGRPTSRGSSMFRGVAWNHSTQKWMSRIDFKNKQLFLGCYPTQEDAARAYDTAAYHFHGPDASLNFRDEIPGPPDAELMQRLNGVYKRSGQTRVSGPGVRGLPPQPTQTPQHASGFYTPASLALARDWGLDPATLALLAGGHRQDGALQQLDPTRLGQAADPWLASLQQQTQQQQQQQQLQQILQQLQWPQGQSTPAAPPAQQQAAMRPQIPTLLLTLLEPEDDEADYEGQGQIQEQGHAQGQVQGQGQADGTAPDAALGATAAAEGERAAAAGAQQHPQHQQLDVFADTGSAEVRPAAAADGSGALGGALEAGIAPSHMDVDQPGGVGSVRGVEGVDSMALDGANFVNGVVTAGQAQGMTGAEAGLTAGAERAVGEQGTAELQGNLPVLGLGPGASDGALGFGAGNEGLGLGSKPTDLGASGTLDADAGGGAVHGDTEMGDEEDAEVGSGDGASWQEGGGWEASLLWEGQRVFLGQFADDAEVLPAYERALEYLQTSGMRVVDPLLPLPEPPQSSLTGTAPGPEPSGSGYRGVHKLETQGRRPWQARIMHKGRCLLLGCSRTEAEAARTYDRAAHYLQGREALLNFPGEVPPVPDAAFLARLRGLGPGGTGTYLGSTLVQAQASALPNSAAAAGPQLPSNQGLLANPQPIGASGAAAPLGQGQPGQSGLGGAGQPAGLAGQGHGPALGQGSQGQAQLTADASTISSMASAVVNMLGMDSGLGGAGAGGAPGSLGMSSAAGQLAAAAQALAQNMLGAAVAAGGGGAGTGWDASAMAPLLNSASLALPFQQLLQQLGPGGQDPAAAAAAAMAALQAAGGLMPQLGEPLGPPAPLQVEAQPLL